MDEMADAQPDQVGAPPPPQSPLARLLDADWGAVGAAVLPILLALVAGSQLAALTAWLAGDSPASSTDVGSYLSALTMIACATFFGGISASNEAGHSDGFQVAFSVHAVPLGITLLVLATAWFAIKRSARGDQRERTGIAVRVSVIVALVVLALALLSRVDSGLGDGEGVVHANAVESFIGALALLLATTVLAARGAEPWLTARLGSWLAPVRGAVSGLVAACVLGFIAGLIAVVITVAVYDGSLADVLRGLPLALAFLPNLGLAVAHVALLGTLDISFAAFFGGGGGVGLLARHGAPAWYWLLVVIAPVVIAVAIARALRTAEPEDDAAARLVAYRVALPLAVGWMLLGLASRVAVGSLGFGSSAGPTVWQTLVLPALWAGVLGFLLAGPLRRVATPRRPSRRLRAPLQVSTLCLGFVVASVLLAAGAAAGARSNGSDAGPFGLSDSEVSGGSASVGAVISPSGTQSGDVSSADLHALAEDVAKAERTYFDQHGEYTTELHRLAEFGFEVPVGTQWSASTVGDSICIVLGTGPASWTFNSEDTANPVKPGDRC